MLLKELAPATDSFTLRISDDREMRELNRVYRGIDKSTDVLSFLGSETVEGRHLGDVVVSVETAARQARVRRRNLESELQVLILHGVLHCLGYDHETDNGEMEKVERDLRRRFVGSSLWLVS